MLLVVQEREHAQCAVLVGRCGLTGTGDDSVDLPAHRRSDRRGTAVEGNRLDLCAGLLAEGNRPGLPDRPRTGVGEGERTVLAERDEILQGLRLTVGRSE